MKKRFVLLFTIFCILLLAGCNKKNTYEIEISVPTGSTEDFVYSDEEIRPTRNKITIWSGAGLGDTEVILQPVDETVESGYTATYLTRGMPVKFDTANVQDEWFKIGVSVQNDSDRGPIAVSVQVEGAEVRIAETPGQGQDYFNAVVLEASSNVIFAECTECESGAISIGSEVMVSTDTISSEEVPILTVGDRIRVDYIGDIMETYPLQLQGVISIFWIDETGEIVTEPAISEDTDTGAMIPMVMINGELYLDTGFESSVEARCGVMDGTIDSAVSGTEKPVKDNQSNFGTDFGYQYGPQEGTIEIYMNESWRIFATEEVRQQILISAKETVTFQDKTFNKSDLSQETIEWLENYNSLSEEEQLAISYIPSELYELCGYPTAEDMVAEETWGIALTAENVTPTSVIIKCTQSGGEPTGELQTGSWYIVENWTQESCWKEMPYIIQDNTGWTDEAWMIPADDKVEWEVNWEWLYGELPAGKYRIGKEITDFRASGDFDKAIYFAEFIIE